MQLVAGEVVRPEILFFTAPPLRPCNAPTVRRFPTCGLRPDLGAYSAGEQRQPHGELTSGTRAGTSHLDRSIVQSHVFAHECKRAPALVDLFCGIVSRFAKTW
jgi:hypothetical protein